MLQQSKQWFYQKIATIEIAEEIITTSIMKSETKQVFLRILESAKDSNNAFRDDDWLILRERLAGWMARNQKIESML